MTATEFKSTLAHSQPPAGLGPIPLALWYDGKGDWDMSHTIVQDIDTNDAAWIHAYLHRKEGDPSNAAYWYRRAGKPIFTGSLEQEWDSLVNHFLN